MHFICDWPQAAPPMVRNRHVGARLEISGALEDKDGRDALQLTGRATFERQQQQRTARVVLMPLAGGDGIEVVPVRGRDGLIVAADVVLRAA